MTLFMPLFDTAKSIIVVIQSIDYLILIKSLARLQALMKAS